MSHFETFDIHDEQRSNGDIMLALRLGSKRLGNTRDQAITCNLYPQRRIGEEPSGYIREISSQLGCKIRCFFCGCGPFKDNLNPDEVMDLVRLLMDLAGERHLPIIGPYKTSFTDGGEIIANPQCMEILGLAESEPVNPTIKISTALPDTQEARSNIEGVIARIRDRAKIALQVSLSSTNERRRQSKSRVPLISMGEIKGIGEEYVEAREDSQKVTLSFTLTKKPDCNPEEMVETLPPELFAVRLHPYKQNNIRGVSPIDEKLCDQLEQRFRLLNYHIFRDRYEGSELDWFKQSATRPST